jgi:hypothetical protein
MVCSTLMQLLISPTFSNFSPASNTATDIVALVTDNPQQMYEIMSADTVYNNNETVDARTR